MNKPTKKQLEDRIAELEAMLGGRTEVAAGREDTLAAEAHQNKISSMSKRLDREEVKLPRYEVRSLLAGNVGATVTDVNGNKKGILWEKRGDVHLLTADQIQELRENRDLFYDGFLAAPEVIAPSQNVIEDYNRFIAKANSETVHERINDIDSSAVLLDFFHFIENKRMNDKGEFVPLPVKDQLVLMAIMNRLNALIGFNFTATDVE